MFTDITQAVHPGYGKDERLVNPYPSKIKKLLLSAVYPVHFFARQLLRGDVKSIFFDEHDAALG